MNSWNDLLLCYPQLQLPVRTGMKDSPLYRDVVLSGAPLPEEERLPFEAEAELSSVTTPAGNAQILWLARREDFERVLCALAYRCEPAEIPASVGASTVRGLINWGKINAHKAAYLAAGGDDWAAEFRRFTADRKNYRDTLIVLSNGDYSAVSADVLGLSADVWTEKSLSIRKYHELTHFVCRELYPEDVDAIRDEVLADLIGLVAAFDRYDPALARRFLGIENGHYREGGRLSHYAKEDELGETVARADRLIDDYGAQVPAAPEGDVFDLLLRLFAAGPRVHR